MIKNVITIRRALRNGDCLHVREEANRYGPTYARLADGGDVSIDAAKHAIRHSQVSPIETPAEDGQCYAWVAA